MNILWLIPILPDQPRLEQNAQVRHQATGDGIAAILGQPVDPDMVEGRRDPVAPASLTSAEVLRAFDGYQTAQREASGVESSGFLSMI